MKLSHVSIVFGIILANISFARAAMDDKIWICENGLRRVALTFDEATESLGFRICADKKCTTAESSGDAKLASSVGSHYIYNIANSKTGERLTINFSANANKGAIPKDGKILSVEKGTNNISDPSENFKKCEPKTRK